MKRVAAQIADQEPRIDVLINNAGALFAQRQLYTATRVRESARSRSGHRNVLRKEVIQRSRGLTT